MSTAGTAATTRVTVMPTMRYDDAPAAIEWLCRAFGFEKHLVVPGEHGTIAHAQLVFGNGMIMLGSSSDDAWGRIVRSPRAVGGATSAPYVIVSDVDAHHARAVAAGAEIIDPPQDKEYGGRGYGCRDCEGNPWYFGSYDPFA